MHNSRYTITLVHGTFARDAKWIDPDSEFSRLIASKLNGEARFFPFRWSGKNSHVARMKASRQLTGHLWKLIRKFPSSRHFIIAHSHGGNVALSALKELHPKNGSIDGLVCLGTPFFSIKLREEDHGCLVLVAWAMISLGLGFYLGSDLHEYLVPFVVMGAAGFIFFIGLFAYLQLLHLAANRAKRLNVDPEMLGMPVLAIRPKGDEARGWLRSMVFLSQKSGTLYKFLGWCLDNGEKLLAWTYGLGLLFLFIAAIIEVTGGPATYSDLSGGVGILVSVGLTAVFLLLIIPSLIINFFSTRLTHGGMIGFGEALIDSFYLKTEILDRNTKVVDLGQEDARGSSRLKHSQIYESSMVIKDVVAWIESNSSI